MNLAEAHLNKYRKIKLVCYGGMDIAKVIYDALELCEDTGVDVQFHFNDVTVKLIKDKKSEVQV
jgi:hypothetical protein